MCGLIFDDGFNQKYNDWKDSGSDSKTYNRNTVEIAELMCCTMRKCTNSWFERHKSSSAMAMGTTNEQPMFEALRNEPCVHHLYEVGLL